MMHQQKKVKQVAEADSFMWTTIAENPVESLKCFIVSLHFLLFNQVICMFPMFFGIRLFVLTLGLCLHLLHCAT